MDEITFKKFNSLTARFRPKTFQPSESTVHTVPDLTMSIQEILERHTRGLSFTQGRVPIYQDDDDDNFYPDVSRMDLADIEELKKSTDFEIQKLKDDAKKQKHAKQQKATKAADKATEVPPSNTAKADGDKPAGNTTQADANDNL